jgi:hypothetical protein
MKFVRIALLPAGAAILRGPAQYVPDLIHLLEGRALALRAKPAILDLARARARILAAAHKHNVHPARERAGVNRAKSPITYLLRAPLLLGGGACSNRDMSGLVDGIVVGLLAIADIAFLAHLRRRRARALRIRRMWRSLALAVRRANSDPAGVANRPSPRMGPVAAARRQRLSVERAEAR